MSSEFLASGENVLDSNLGGAWDITNGYAGRKQDLGIARRFGGSAAAYSLRDIGAMNGRVVKVRRDLAGEEADPEEDFSANQVSSGALENWVNGKLENTLPADVDTAAAAYSLRKVKKTYSGKAVRIRRIDNTEVDVAFDSDGKVSTSSSITNVESGDVDDTAETTLGNFLQGEADVRALFNASSYNPSSGSDNFWRATTELDLGSGAMSFSCDFVVTGEFGSNTSRIVQKYDGSTYFYWETSTSFRYKIDGTSGTTAISSSVTLQRGRKYNMEFSRDASNNTTLKINGVTVGTNTNTARNTGQILIGRIAGFRLEGVALNFNFNNGQHIYAGDGNETSNWVDTGTGGNNLSKEGSPVLFTGQGMDSFVHNWYDQAGSNNAVQGTAGSQPKIAENGALLDGIKFNAATDGTSPNFLQVATKLGVTTDHFVSAVFNGYQTDSSAFGAFLNTRNGNAGFQYGIASTDKVQAFFYAGAGNNANSSSSFTLSNNSAKRLVTFDKDGNNLTGFGNATTNGISLSNGINTPSTTVTNIGVGGNVGTTTSLGLRANINELIVYETDQADNRFKIESNINNYYGLYNDANELSAAFDSNGTITNASKDGFTADVATFSHYVNATFNNSVATGETIYASFNAQLAPNGGTAASPILRLQDAQVGSNTSNQSSISEGFNSIDLTATGTSDRVGFLEQDDNVDYIISDFRVSRIARNGFVQTWYDQSGNNRPMIQASASEQPSIVENGGFVGGVKADAATSNSTMQNLQVSTDGTTANFGTNDWANGGTKLGLIYVGKVLTGTTATNPAPFWGAGRGVSQYQTGAVSFQVIKAGADSFRLVNERQDLSPSSMTTSLTFNSDDDIIVTGTTDNRDFTLTVNASSNSETESADLDTRETTAISLFGSYDKNAGRYYQRSSAGVCKECYLYSGDNISEVATIATEINKHYNIY